MTAPALTAAAIDIADVDLLDIPKTLTAAADALRVALDELGSWARPWRYQLLNNWPHAGYVTTADANPFGAVVDVHAPTKAGAYLELMAPPMAAAVVDWLTAAAERERQYPDALLDRRAEPVSGDEASAALVVAHTVLQVLRQREQDPTR